MVNGHRKYAPKYAAERLVTFAGVMSSRVRKWEFNTSRRPYAKPQRKNKIVTEGGLTFLRFPVPEWCTYLNHTE
jgi:hypothetical protein